ncbi:MAG: hypothetical protein JXB05_00800 [Myxococcaceae bacterium]|nr:hypothetical protein [Myxococcaceae bacterium]
MVTLGGLFLAMALHTAPPVPTAGQIFDPQVCAKKRVDACGCHHVYGIRHCHPNRKSDHCEAPVKAPAPEKEAKDSVSL